MTSSQEQDQFPIGTVVTIDDPRCPGLYKVTGRGPKNYTLVPVSTEGKPREGRSARMPDYLLHRWDPVADPHAAGPGSARMHFVVGEVVTISTRPGVWVVIADKVDRVNIVQLGGDHDRYLRVHPASLTRVALRQLPALL